MAVREAAEEFVLAVVADAFGAVGGGGGRGDGGLERDAQQVENPGQHHASVRHQVLVGQRVGGDALGAKVAFHPLLAQQDAMDLLPDRAILRLGTRRRWRAASGPGEDMPAPIRLGRGEGIGLRQDVAPRHPEHYPATAPKTAGNIDVRQQLEEAPDIDLEAEAARRGMALREPREVAHRVPRPDRRVEVRDAALVEEFVRRADQPGVAQQVHEPGAAAAPRHEHDVGHLDAQRVPVRRAGPPRGRRRAESPVEEARRAFGLDGRAHASSSARFHCCASAS